MEQPESTVKEDSTDDEMVAELITNKLNELYREAHLSQIGDTLVVKSNLLAEAFRVNGDQHFAAKSFEDARRNYTLCLAYAEDDSKEIGNGYANRSAALFKLGYFKQCLLDIDRALNSNYPEDKKNGLHERKEKALKNADRFPAPDSSRNREVEAGEWRDKLCHFPNPDIPGASKKIKLENDESWGRHVVATENINAGEILTSQKFFTLLKSEDLEAEGGHVTTEFCSYCLLYSPALIPCPTCVHAMYCSEHCRTQAFDSYHRIECRIFKMIDVRSSKIDKNDIMALRCLLVGTGQGAGLASLVKKMTKPDIVDLETNFDKFTEKPFSSDYMILLGLCRKFDKSQSEKVKFIPRIIIALQKAGYFDGDPDRLQHEASIDPKADGINISKSEKNDDCNETTKDISLRVLDSVERPDESDDKREDPDEGKNEYRQIVEKYADILRMVGTSSKNAEEQVKKGVTEASEERLTMREAHNDAKDGNDDESVYKKDGDISSKLLDSVEIADESDDKREDPDEGKNEYRQIVEEYADFLTMVGTSSKNADEQNEAHIDAKDGNDDESVYEKDGDISSKVLDSVKIADESIDQEEDPGVGKDEDDRPVVIQDHEHSSRIVDGKEFIKKVTRHFCELCDLYLCYDPKISQNEIVLAHCRTPLHVERCPAKNSEEKECVTETSPSENVILGTMAKKPQLDTPSKRRSRKKKSKARSKSASDARSDDTNEQKKIKKLRTVGKPPLGPTSIPGCSTATPQDDVRYSTVILESIDQEEDPGVGKDDYRPVVIQEHEDSSRIEVDGLKLALLLATVILKANDKKEDSDGSENEVRPQEHEESPEIAGKEFIKEVLDYHCELCNLCLCYNQEMSEEEALLAHCRTPLHMKQSSLKTTEGKDVSTRECVTETLLSKTAEEPPSESTLQPPESTTEISTSPLDSLPASSDANEQNLVKHEQYMTAMELYASFFLLKHKLSLDNATFGLRQGDIFYEEVVVYGYGVCIFPAMINHSCDPNVDFITRGQEMALYALRPIPKGEQIFITYTIYPFAFNSLQERQQKMSHPSSKFQFHCKCEACVNKWPMYDDLLKLRPKFLLSNKKAAIKTIRKITSPVTGKPADSTSRLEIIQVIGRLCDWLYTNVEKPYAISADCESLLARAVKLFYDTSMLFEMTELRKKEFLLACISKIVSYIRIDLQQYL